MFQFHKVQLKAEPKPAGAAAPAFQFHKVQLKGRTGRRAGIRIRCFNSIRYN